jgi:hypothetical protein
VVIRIGSVFGTDFTYWLKSVGRYGWFGLELRTEIA